MQNGEETKCHEMCIQSSNTWNNFRKNPKKKLKIFCLTLSQKFSPKIKQKVEKQNTSNSM